MESTAGPRRCRREPPLWTYGPLRIRRYASDDHATVFALHRACLDAVGVRPGDGVYYDDDFGRIEEVYLCNRGEFLVGEVHGVIVALGGVRRVDSGTAEMVRLRVRGDLQGLGYGGAMIRALEERAVELGYRLLRGDTTIKQQQAIDVYLSLGWRIISRRATGDTITVYGEKPL